MADPFTPKFVDLVKNTTTTVGTGNFALGPAVNGFAGFAQALQTGDSFYYSCIGVDKPAEREVGRGTLLAGGTISRDAIGGVETNFTTGTKTIALIAAAEWFTQIQAGGSTAAGGGLATAASCAALAALTDRTQPVLLTAAGRDGLFLFDGSNRSAAVAADPQQAIYVAPSSDPSGASGAWVRQYSGAADARWFGAAGDGVTDDAAALQAWLDHGGKLFLPTGRYRSSQSLKVRKTCAINGESYGYDSRLSGGSPAMPGARIVFDAGVAGLDIQPQTTLTDPAAVIAAGASAWTQEGAYNSIIEHIGLIGGGGAAATGVYARTFFHARNVRVVGFSGKGWDLSASTGSGDGNSEYGNMSNSSLVDCSAEGCGSHGLHIRGIDANTIAVTNFTAIENGGWGILNESVIGNTFIKPNLASNASGAIKVPGATGCAFQDPFIEGDAHSNCDLNGNCTVTGGDLNGVNTGDLTCYSVQPRLNKTKFVGFWSPEALTSEQAFAYRWDGLWLQGRGSTKDVSLINRDGLVTAYIPAGTRTLRANSLASDSNVVANSAYDSTVFGNRFQTGGINSTWPGVADGYATMFAHGASGLVLGGYGTTYDTSLYNKSGNCALAVLAGTVNVYAAGTVDAVGGYKVNGTAVLNGAGMLQAGAFPALTGDVTTVAGSLATTIANGAVSLAKMANVASGTVFYRKTASSGAPEVQTLATLKTDLGLTGTNSGDQFTGVTASRLLGNPTGAAAAASEIGLAGGLAFSGATLTAAGALTPTSVACTGALTSSSASAGVGYATGGGGAVTQLTSKSTGVTLSKVSGQITTNNASLAAAGVVSFTVTNSAVTATDTINLNLASGNATAGTYRHWVEGIAAGSFKIVIENRSAGALSEALVFNFAVLKAVNA